MAIDFSRYPPPRRPTLLVSIPNPNVVVLGGVPPHPYLRFIMEQQRNQSLVQFMTNHGLLPTPADEVQREEAIVTLRLIVQHWVQKVAWQRGLSTDEIANTSATIFTYGSYGLGAHGPDSDIDALCVGPSFATPKEDFFIVLCNILQNHPEISHLHCVKDAKVPLMRFKFKGISIDLPYAQLKQFSVLDKVDVLSPSLSSNIDEISWKSLSGVRANMRILQLVPNVENFQILLRCFKFWAKRRGVYCNLFGFFGGIHIAVLAAYVCQRHPNASISFLISNFFETFAFWPWPQPVLLEEGSLAVGGEITEIRSLMPIQLPGSPDEYCYSNITKSTFQRIREELRRGSTITRLLRADFEWSGLFDPFAYSKKYNRFVRILLAAESQDELGDWVGWVKSRFRSLLLKLEEVQGLCDPNPTEYVDPDVELPNIVFYWGLQAGRSVFKNAEFVEDYFLKHINSSNEGPAAGTFKLSILDSSELPKNAQYDDTGCGKAYWRMLDHHLHLQRKMPIYSSYLPNYVVGYGHTSAAG